MRTYESAEEALTFGHGIERTFLCPVHGDNNASASINSLSGLWICYACGARGKVDANNVVIHPDSVVRELAQIQKIMTEKPVRYAESWLDQYDAVGPGDYWLGRYSPEVCRRYRLGYDPQTKAAVYPLRTRTGEVMGVVRRSLLNEGPKYLYPYGVDIRKLLFDYHRCEGDTIFLVEGATDAIALNEVGVEAMALYGSSMSRTQAALLRAYNPKRIISAFDQDRAGDQAHRAVSEQFGVIVTRPKWGEYKDVSEMPVDVRASFVAKVLDRCQRGQVASPTCTSLEKKQPQSPEAPRSSSQSSEPLKTGRVRLLRT